MADYRTHITTSGALGVCYGLTATIATGFNPVQGALAAVLTGVAGMLPDLDSDSGRPVRAVFGLLAAVAPLVLLNRLEQWGGGREPALLLAVLLYIAIRYGALTLLSMVSVHRGMFHSVPALLIAAELTFLAYLTDSSSVRWLMALGVALGFGSHLVLDEIYSVRWNGAIITLKPSAGSAVKFVGKSWPVNIFVYGLALTLGYGVVVDGGWNVRRQDDNAAEPEKTPFIAPHGQKQPGRDDFEEFQPPLKSRSPESLADRRRLRSSLSDDEEIAVPHARREQPRR